MKRVVIILCILAGLAILWMSRYSIYTGSPIAYKLDRFTGKVTLLRAEHEHDITKVGLTKEWGFLPAPSPGKK